MGLWDYLIDWGKWRRFGGMMERVDDWNLYEVGVGVIVVLLRVWVLGLVVIMVDELRVGCEYVYMVFCLW